MRKLILPLLAIGAVLGFGGFVAQQTVGYDPSTGTICLDDRAVSSQCAPIGIVDRAKRLVDLVDGGERVAATYDRCLVVRLGASDNTTALQTAITRAIGDERPVCVFGSGPVAGNLTIRGAVKIRGAGQNKTQLTLTGTGVAVDVRTTASVEISDLTLATPTDVTGQTQIRIAPTSGENTKSVFRDMTFYGYLIGLDTVRASTWIVDGVTFSSARTNSVGLVVANENNPDSGDGTVSNSLFAGVDRGNTTGILWRSSGGLRVVNNKFNRNSHALIVRPSEGVVTSDLLVTGNSIEGYAAAAIVFTRAGRTGTFENISITGNQFAGTIGGVGVVSIPTDPVGPWLKTLSITGNTVSVGGTAASIVFDIASVVGFSIVGNGIDFVGAAGTDVRVGRSASRGVVAHNVSTGFAATTRIEGSDVAHGVTCPAGSVSPSTLEISAGLVTHC